MSKPIFSSPEPLEARIAPASVVITDPVDHTKSLTITSSVGTASDLSAVLTHVEEQASPTVGFGVWISLAGHAKFAHADFTLSTTGGAFLIVHSLDASGFDVGTVTVRGDLDQILAGDGNLSTPAIKKLDVDTLGDTSKAASVVHGAIGTLNIVGDLSGTLTTETKAGSIGTATIGIADADNGNDGDNIGSLFVGGNIGTLTVDQLEGSVGAKSGSIFVAGSISHATISDLYGGTGEFSGSLHADGNLPDVKITGGIHGNSGSDSHASNAAVTAFGKIGTITVTGQVQGGFADHSGQIAAGVGIGTAVLTGGLSGGHGFESGSIGALGPLGSITLGPGTGTDIMVGGAGAKSGSILCSTVISSVTVNGDIVGGDGANSAEIASAGTLTKVVVHGKLTGGDVGAGSGAIGSTGALGDVTVDGAVTGGKANASGEIVSATSIHSVTLHDVLQGGLGAESGAIGSLGHIGTVTVDGDVTGGDGTHSGSVLTFKTIGQVTLGGSLIGSTGTSGSESASANAVILAGVSIGSVTVKGDVQGGSYLGSAVIEAGSLPSVTIHGDILGGDGAGSGAVIGDSSVGKVTVDGSIKAGTNDHTGIVSSGGSITSVHVGGSLDGTNPDDSGAFSGAILAQAPRINTTLPLGVIVSALPHNIGTVTIDGEILGGNESDTGIVLASGNITSVTVGTQGITFAKPLHAASFLIKASGDIVGGSSTLTGAISAGGNIGSVTVFGGILGGGGSDSGAIRSQGAIGSVKVSFNLTGSSGPRSGSIYGRSIGAVEIDGDLIGGQNDHAGSIVAFGTDIAKVFVGGDIGVASGSTFPTYISAQRNLGSVEAGSITGLHDTTAKPAAYYDVYITAGGNLQARNAAQALAIGAVTVHTTMAYTTIEAGYDASLQQVNGHVRIGAIDVGKDAAAANIRTVWTENDVIAGATGHTLDDVEIDGGNKAILSEVVSVIIRGNLSDTTQAHEVIADLIDSASAGSGTAMKLPLTAGAHNDYISFEAPIDPSSSTAFHEIGVRLT